MQKNSSFIICDIFHSAMLVYFAIMSPTPDEMSFAGAPASIPRSPTTASAHFEGRETLSPERSIDEVAEAKPSIDGAVAAMIYGHFFAADIILQVSFMTPPPTPMTESAPVGQYMSASPTILSSGFGIR